MRPLKVVEPAGAKLSVAAPLALFVTVPPPPTESASESMLWEEPFRSKAAPLASCTGVLPGRPPPKPSTWFWYTFWIWAAESTVL